MKVSLLLLFVLNSFGATAQSSIVKQDTLGGSGSSGHPFKGRLILYEHAGKPLIAGRTYTYTAMLSPGPITSSLTVVYGDHVPKIFVTVDISDTTGKRIQSTTFTYPGKRTAIDLSTLKPGPYRILVYGDDDRVLLRNNFTKE